MLLWSHQSSTEDLFVLRFGEGLQPLTWLTGPQMARPTFASADTSVPHGPAQEIRHLAFFPSLVFTSGPLMLSSSSPAWHSFLSPCSSVLLSGKPPSSLRFIYLFLTAPSLCCRAGFSRAVVSGGCSGACARAALCGASLPVVHGLLV